MNDKVKKESITPNIFMIAVSILIILIIPGQIDNSVQADRLGPRFVPYAACALVLLPNLLQMCTKALRNKRARDAGTPEPSSGAAKPPFGGICQRLVRQYWVLAAVMAMAFTATFVVKYLGYVVTYCLLCAGMLLLFREKRWYHYLITFALVAAVYIGFTRFLYVPLPSLF